MSCSDHQAAEIIAVESDETDGASVSVAPTSAVQLDADGAAYELAQGVSRRGGGSAFCGALRAIARFGGVDVGEPDALVRTAHFNSVAVDHAQTDAVG